MAALVPALLPVPPWRVVAFGLCHCLQTLVPGFVGLPLGAGGLVPRVAGLVLLRSNAGRAKPLPIPSHAQGAGVCHLCCHMHYGANMLCNKTSFPSSTSRHVPCATGGLGRQRVVHASSSGSCRGQPLAQYLADPQHEPEPLIYVGWLSVL